jgi:hypothetical protein
MSHKERHPMLDLSQTKSIWFERMLEKQNMVTSYKAFWLKGILAEVVSSQARTISFDRTVCRMIAEAWFPLIQYKLNFGVQDQLGKVVTYLESTYHYGSDVKKDKLLNLLYYSDELACDKEFQRLKENFYQMVPYRLINPFFTNQTAGIKDQKKNRLIVDLSLRSEEIFYKIDDELKTITIGEDWIEYIMENQSILFGWLGYRLTEYLQNKNLSVPNILLKLEPPTNRNHSRATKYWKEAAMRRPLNELYSGIRLMPENYSEFGAFSIDHFVPWSFVLHDELWNLVPIFKTTNSSKGNRLPNLDKYLNEFARMHYDTFMHMRQIPSKHRVLEDYTNLGGNLNTLEILNVSNNINPDMFIDAIIKTVTPIYQIAYNQGFEVWDNH